MKKKLLFVIDSLHCAGAEKSLTTLLSLLDYSKYSVDLQLFAYGGMFEELVPEEVNVLNPLLYTEFCRYSIKDAILYSIKQKNFRMLLSRLTYSFKIRINQYNNTQKARVFWQSCSNAFNCSIKKYDVAISYAQGVPTYYVVEKVDAIKKLAWVNASYKLYGEDKEFQIRYYNKYNKIVTVSDSAKKIFLETFPEYINKVLVIYDINNPTLVLKMAKMKKGYNDGFKGIRLLTIGRLSRKKGYDIALEACKKLKERSISFKWYVLGEGPLKKEIETFIKNNNLSQNFILLGVKSNPYPYIKNCDIYIQTSRSEGFGLAIAEARMLNKPVVATKFDSVFNQMINEKNGLVVDMNAGAVYEGIYKLIHNIKLKESIVKYLKTEQKGNVEEIEKFYQLIQ